MSSLRETIEQRRAAELPTPVCATLGSSPFGLLIEIWDGESWMLPWSHLTGVRASGTLDREVLELTFAEIRVKARGHNLRGLLPEIANLRLVQLGNLPKQYGSKFSPSAPFVAELEVTPAPSLREKESSQKTMGSS